jgi:hypothetical protein
VRINRGMRVMATPTAIFRRIKLKSAIRIDGSGPCTKALTANHGITCLIPGGLNLREGVELEGNLPKLAVALARNDSVSTLDSRGNNKT